MKKIFAFLMVAGFALAFAACGGAKKDEAAKKAADSIAAAAKADSIAKVEAAAAAAKMKADSAKVADSLANLAKTAKKK